MADDISQIILDELRAHRQESAQRHEGFDKRIRKVEIWQADASGKMTMLGLVGVVAGGIVTWLTQIFRH